MTTTKVSKTIAILLAMCLAFALMSVTMTNTARAAETKLEGTDFTFSMSEPDTAQNTGKTNWYVADRDSYEKVPDFKVSIAFKNNDGKLGDSALTEVVALYDDSQLQEKIDLSEDVFTDIVKTSSEISFTAQISKVSSLKENNTYYLVFKSGLTETEANDGEEIVVEFAVPGKKTTTTSSTTTSTTATTKKTTRTITTQRTTNRTIRTTARTLRTVTTANNRAKPAQTDDPSHMPLWVSVAILSAGALGIAYVWKQPE